MNYYLIKCTKEDGGYTRPIVRNIVISEEPESFLLRNSKEDILHPYFTLDWFKPISEKSYKQLLENNPTREGYFSLTKRDYSKSV